MMHRNESTLHAAYTNDPNAVVTVSCILADKLKKLQTKFIREHFQNIEFQLALIFL